MDPPRLLMVSHYFAPSSATGALRSTRLARFLSERNGAPVVLTVPASFYGDRVVEGPAEREEFDVREVAVARRRARAARAGGLRRWVANLTLARAYGRALGELLDGGERFDFLYVHGHPFWYFPVAAESAARYGLPCVLDFEDVWHMGGLSYRMGQRAGPRALIDRWGEARAVRGAAVVVHTTEAQTRLYRERYPEKPPSEFLTVRWGYDEDRMAEARANAPPPEPGGPVRLAIFGKFAAYDPADARALAAGIAAADVERGVEALHLGEPEPALRAAFEEVGLGGALRSLGMRPYDEGLRMLAGADMLVLNAISDLSLPVKLYDYVGLNRPVLAFVRPDSEAGRLLEPLPGAFVVRTAGQAAHAIRAAAAGGVARLADGLDTAEFSQQHQFKRLMGRLARLMEAREP